MEGLGQTSRRKASHSSHRGVQHYRVEGPGPCPHSMLCTSCCCSGKYLCCMQYAELAYHAFERNYWYAGLLLSITVFASLTATGALYKKQLQLYMAVANYHIIPLVQAGIVRCAAESWIQHLLVIVVCRVCNVCYVHSSVVT